jgi:hypothetical protein
LEADRLNIIEEAKALLLELTELRSKMDLEKEGDVAILREKILELNDTLVLLQHLLKHGDSALVRSEVQAYVEESERELEDIEEETEEMTSDDAPQVDVPSEEVEEVDVKDLEEQEKAMGLQGNSIHDREEDSEDNSIAKKLELQPIEDLKKAIGLNERFYYANELFQGDGQEYARAIEEFNHLGSIDDAQRLIEAKYNERYHWDKHEDARDSLLILLRRRYLNEA